jgi:RNA polymerase sigma-70 factor, ECF subfamily
MLTDNDIQLMLRFRDGDRKSFEILFDKYKKRVINYCYRYCGHRAVAEELAQETFLRVYKAAERYRPEAQFSTWLFKIAANVCLNEIRKPVYNSRIESIEETEEERHDAALEMSDKSPHKMPDMLLETQEEQVLIRKAMDRLPGEQRAALLLRATEGFSYHEIGMQINRSEKNVKTLIYRARQHIKQILEEDWGKE